MQVIKPCLSSPRHELNCTVLPWWKSARQALKLSTHSAEMCADRVAEFRDSPKNTASRAWKHTFFFFFHFPHNPGPADAVSCVLASTAPGAASRSGMWPGGCLVA